MTFPSPLDIEEIKQSYPTEARFGDVRSLWLRLLLKGLSGLQRGRLVLVLPEGQVFSFGSGQPADLRAQVTFHRAKGARRFLLGGDIGVAEAFRQGDWDTPDLTALFRLILANEDSIGGMRQGGILSRLYFALRHRLRANSKAGSKRNIAYHYDLGNAFYKQWLDSTMSYSAALFTQGAESLEQAQIAKYQRIAELAELKPKLSVLEVGCGWGGFAEQAVLDHDCRVTGLTLSREQLHYANRRFARLGLADRASAQYCDYRDAAGRYDRVVSIEMFEAVGEENWDTYFKTLRARLNDGGCAVIQSITIADDRFDSYRQSADFIQHYIFPGGMLPSPSRFAAKAAEHGFVLEHQEFFGPCYAKTLRLWHDKFVANWETLKPLGFDEGFKRLWQYYLSYCEAGFLQGSIDVGLFKLRKA